MRVHLEYYKESGKYYSDGEYESRKEHAFEVFTEVREMVASGKRPGLVDCEPGANRFSIRVFPDGEYPALISPSTDDLKRDAIVEYIADEARRLREDSSRWECVDPVLARRWLSLAAGLEMRAEEIRRNGWK